MPARRAATRETYEGDAAPFFTPLRGGCRARSVDVGTGFDDLGSERLEPRVMHTSEQAELVVRAE